MPLFGGLRRACLRADATSVAGMSCGPPPDEPADAVRERGRAAAPFEREPPLCGGRAQALPFQRDSELWTTQKLGRAAFELDSLGRPAGPNGLGSVGSLGLRLREASSPT
jgi:hypothetical protein